MADQWNITLGARYSYDVKGMTYITGSNAVGIPSQIIAPDNTTGSNFNQVDPSTWYTTQTFGLQKAVVDGAIAALPAAALAQITEFAAIDANNDPAGGDDYRAAFAKVVELQGIGIAPIGDASAVFEVNKKAIGLQQILKILDYKRNNKCFGSQ